MNGAETMQALARFAPGVLCNAHPAVRAMRPSIRPLFPGAALCGPAKTVSTGPGQNAAIHRAVHTAKPGEVLVVDGGGEHSCGAFGDLLAICCGQQGVAGLVIDGAVRDTRELAEMGFPVFCSGVNANAAAKSDPGEMDLPVDCGGVRVRPGDIVVGGGDGVAVVPRGIVEDVIARAGEVLAREEAVRVRLAAGETTCDILGIEPWTIQ